MRYIGRFKDADLIQYFVDNFDGEVLDEYKHLNMLVFEYDGEESIFSLDDLKELFNCSLHKRRFVDFT